jgi:transcriptional regulator with XRE-family HTH domain
MLPLAKVRPVCDDVYAGTREGFILVSKAPPKGRPKASTAEQDQQARDQAKAKRDGGGNAGLDGDGARRRAELADFLRNRRAALRPEEVGLPGGGRRRTPGLRREEVAQLAGVGTTWYTWLEQGREVRASLSVLEALARALELTPAERAHLVMLGRGEEVALPEPPKEEIPPTLQRLIENLGMGPACILGRRWDFLAWNPAFAVIFGDPAEMPEGRRNLIWSILTDPKRRKLMTDWEESARNAVARFRADSARHVGDPHFEELIDALHEVSPEFREWWDLHEVARSGIGRKVLRHPKAGKLAFEHAVFKLEERLEQRLILYSPLPIADTPPKLEKLLRQQKT